LSSGALKGLVASLLALVALNASLALLGPVTILVALEAGAGLLDVGSGVSVGLGELGSVGGLSAVTGDMAGLVTVVTGAVTLGLEVAVARGLGIGVGSAGALEGFVSEITTVEALHRLYLFATN
jgi:hypothetical protein